jgi:hypothetical protein
VLDSPRPVIYNPSLTVWLLFDTVKDLPFRKHRYDYVRSIHETTYKLTVTNMATMGKSEVTPSRFNA